VFDTKGQRVGGAWLLAIVTLKTGEQGRHYRLPTAEDYMAVLSAQRAVSQLSSEALPIEEIPRTELRRLSVPLYGISMWKNLFTARQNLALATFTKYIREVDPSVSAALSCVLTKLADKQSTLCGWKTTAEYMGTHTFSRQALGMVWDFCEANPLGAESGSISQELGWVSEVYAMVGNTISTPGTTQMADACTPILPSESAAVWFTDPPYYDSVPYAHLADFFYVWLRRSLATNLREWFQTPLTPKDDECVVDRPHSLSISKKTAKYFENKMQEAMRVGRKTMNQSGIGCIVFAHKTTEGWEALLSGMINAGWMIVASWPITTEMSSRLNARETAALAASIHLICRPRPNDATIGDWSEVLRELASKVGDWMERLQAEGVRGADLVFACIGPAMEVYSSYSKVEDAEGREIPLGGDPTAAEPYKRGFLAYVWETVGRTALGQILGTAEARARNGIAGALEEDARLTALFLWTLQATDGESAKANGNESGEDDESDDKAEGGEKGAKKKGFTLT
jgi:adenine-specific DNA methylase